MTSKELVTRQVVLPTEMTKEKASYLLKVVWPDAPAEAITRAALICAQYQLNPLLRHVALIKFDKYEGRGPDRRKIGEDWTPVLEIKASRIIARRNHSYTYSDGPRMMTEQEQKEIFGEVYPDRLSAIVKLKDAAGNVYPGYGFWLRESMPYGSDKGNTKANMAFIRAERNALDKMAPGELPEVELADSTFVDGDFKEIVAEGREAFLEDDKKTDDLWPENPPSAARIAVKAPTSEAKGQVPVTTKSESVEDTKPEPVDLTWLAESLPKLQGKFSLSEWGKAHKLPTGAGTFAKWPGEKQQEAANEIERLLKKQGD